VSVRQIDLHPRSGGVKAKKEADMRVLGVALSVVFLSVCATGTGVLGTEGRDQVAAATAAWRAAYDSRDPARITAMYERDAVLWGTTAKTVAATPAAVAEYFKDAGTRPNARVAFGEQHIRVYGDVGVNTGYYTFSDVRDGQTLSLSARFTMVFRNRDGKWLIVAHHSSRMP
jgi:uncharacterized protein (TIGR02246 family)